MTAAVKKKDEAQAAHPLLSKPVPHAYALIQDPERPGRFFAVHLTDIVARGIEFLEPSARSEPATYGIVRMDRAASKRHKEKAWTK